MLHDYCDRDIQHINANIIFAIAEKLVGCTWGRPCHYPTRLLNAARTPCVSGMHKHRTRMAPQRGHAVIAHIDTRLRHAPQWFDGSLEELLEKAFKGRIIDHPEHPLITGRRRTPCYEEIEESYP